MNLLDTFREQIREMDPASFLEPKVEVDPSTEKEVGIMDEYLIRLYNLIRRYEQQKDEHVHLIKYTNDEGKQRSAAKSANILSHKINILNGLFWVSVMDTLGLWEYSGNIAIRKGWKVVFVDKDAQIGMMIIESLFRHEHEEE